VVEHVGSRDQQAAFVGELLTTCRRVFIATPNARFPIDPHTLLPFIHRLIPRLRRLVRQRLFGLTTVLIVVGSASDVEDPA
jgi:hypothetical protein